MPTTPALGVSDGCTGISHTRSASKDRVARICVAEASFGPSSDTLLGDIDQADGLNFFETVANFVVFLLRSALLFLPTMMRDVGVVPAAILMMIAVVTVCECSILTMRCCDLAESFPRTSSDSIETFEALAGEALGPVGTSALSFTKNSYFLGLVVVYSLLVTDGIHIFLPDLDVEIVRWCITAPLFCFLGMIRDLKQVKRFAGIGICAGLLQCGLIMVGAGYEMFGPDFKWPEHDISRGGILDIGAALSTCLFGFQSIVVSVPAVRTQMARKEQLPAAIRVSLAIVFLIYLSAICLCYLVFGRGVRGNILDNIIIDCWSQQCVVGVLLEFVLMVNLLIGVPSFVFFVMIAFESAGSGRVFTTLTYENKAFRLILMVMLVTIGMGLPHVKELVGLISSSFGACNCVVFPPLFYLGLKRKQRAAHPTTKHPVPCSDAFRNFCIFLVTIYAMPFGVTGAVQNLIASMTS